MSRAKKLPQAVWEQSGFSYSVDQCMPSRSGVYAYYHHALSLLICHAIDTGTTPILSLQLYTVAPRIRPTFFTSSQCERVKKIAGA